MNKFKAGEVVMLNTGGPAMTINYFTATGVMCVWFDKNTNFGDYMKFDGPFEFEFSEASLTSVDAKTN